MQWNPVPSPIAPAKKTAVKEDCLDRAHKFLGLGIGWCYGIKLRLTP
ncbi:hypothetical protein QUA03_15730 [Microcoleus sp. S36b_A4]